MGGGANIKAPDMAAFEQAKKRDFYANEMEQSNVSAT
jgi:hypothetical protein